MQQNRCNKKGGVCSIRMYVKNAEGRVYVADEPDGELRTVCPNRFKQDQLIYRWVGGELIGSEQPIILGEIGFLEPIGERESRGRGDVGRIDNVLVYPDTSNLRWCALETQSVYFSGDSMTREFEASREGSNETEIDFPVGNRRPDYRSSGPKRLMPQLQIKVPA